jgi:hypothetical protein
MTHAFRLRFRTAKPFTSDEERLTIPEDAHGPAFEIAASPSGSLREAKWLSIRMGGFSSDDEARQHALELTDRLLVVGGIRTMGFDFGQNRVTAGLFNVFRNALERENGFRIRDNIHGLDVFEEDPEQETRFFSVEAHASVTEPPALFSEVFRQIRAATVTLSERQRIALELMNDSLFPASPDAQLLIRVSAMEVLADQGDRPLGVRNVLGRLVDMLPQMDADGEDKRIVREILLNLTKESIGQASRRKVRALLGDDRIAEFNLIYRARSELVHAGKGRGQNAEVAGKALFMAVALINAELKLQ